jgi:multidrug efflux pump subunit AcrB
VLIKWWLFKNAARRGADDQILTRALLPQLSAPAATPAAAQSTTLTVMAALLAAHLGIRLGAAELFPSSNTPIFFVDLWLPYGTDIAPPKNDQRY